MESKEPHLGLLKAGLLYFLCILREVPICHPMCIGIGSQVVTEVWETTERRPVPVRSEDVHTLPYHFTQAHDETLIHIPLFEALQ